MAKGKYQQWLTEDGLLLLQGWARDGLTDEQIANNIGINVGTLYDWKKKHDKISNALKKNKEIVDIIVENALYNKCLGHYAHETVAYKCKEVYWDENGNKCEREEIKTATVKKYIPPDTVAQLAWLNNRKPENWRRNAGKEKLDEKRFEHQKDVDDKKVW